MKIAVTIKEAANMLSVSRGTLYNMLASGEILKVSYHGAARIPVDQLHAITATKIAEAEAERSPFN